MSSAGDIWLGIHRGRPSAIPLMAPASDPHTLSEWWPNSTRIWPDSVNVPQNLVEPVGVSPPRFAPTLPEVGPNLQIPSSDGGDFSLTSAKSGLDSAKCGASSTEFWADFVAVRGNSHLLPDIRQTWLGMGGVDQSWPILTDSGRLQRARRYSGRAVAEERWSLSEGWPI